MVGFMPSNLPDAFYFMRYERGDIVLKDSPIRKKTLVFKGSETLLSASVHMHGSATYISI